MGKRSRFGAPTRQFRASLGSQGRPREPCTSTRCWSRSAMRARTPRRTSTGSTRGFEALRPPVFSCFRLKSSPTKTFGRLNEAIFNLPEEDNLDEDTTGLLFKAPCFMRPRDLYVKAVQKIKKAYSAGRRGSFLGPETGLRCDKDPNFYYDYVALLSTMPLASHRVFFKLKRSRGRTRTSSARSRRSCSWIGFWRW